MRDLVVTGVIFTACRIDWGRPWASDTLSAGMRTSLIPASYAARIFCWTPPIGRTFPIIVISPVMARSLRTGRPVRAETMPVTMVIPADGPSFGTPMKVARTATSKFWRQSSAMPTTSCFALMYWAAASMLSLITRCIDPSGTIRPVPFVACISKRRRHPWSPATASPITSPTAGASGRLTR